MSITLPAIRVAKRANPLTVPEAAKQSLDPARGKRMGKKGAEAKKGVGLVELHRSL